MRAEHFRSPQADDVITHAETVKPVTWTTHPREDFTSGRTAVVTTRPCRAPHPTIADAGLIGGGHLPGPGEGSRAHYGRLCLDERPEFRRHVLEVLRQPLEESVI